MANTRVVLRRMKASEWAAQNPILDFFEIGIEVSLIDGETEKLKFGDAKTAWNDLQYWDWEALTNVEKEIIFETTLGQFDYDMPELTGMIVTEIQFGRFWMIPADWDFDSGVWKILNHDDFETDGVYVKIKYKKDLS